MTALPIIFADGVTDVHIANGVARISFGAAAAQPQGQTEPKAVAAGTLIVPVIQLPALARVMVEITRQVEQRAKAAAQGATGQGSEAEQQQGDAVSGAFRFNG